MLIDTANDKRKARHEVTQEDFTPDNICEILFRNSIELYTDFSKTMLDPCCGNGNLLLFCLTHRLKYCTTADDLYDAIKTLYGTELMEDNVTECKERIIKTLNDTNIVFDKDKMMNILNNNITCTDSNDWDYENWRPKLKITEDELF